MTVTEDIPIAYATHYEDNVPQGQTDTVTPPYQNHQQYEQHQQQQHAQAFATVTGDPRPPAVAVVTGAPRPPGVAVATGTPQPPGGAAVAQFQQQQPYQSPAQGRNGSRTCCCIVWIIVAAVATCCVLPIVIGVLIWAFVIRDITEDVFEDDDFKFGSGDD